MQLPRQRPKVRYCLIPDGARRRMTDSDIPPRDCDRPARRRGTVAIGTGDVANPTMGRTHRCEDRASSEQDMRLPGKARYVVVGAGIHGLSTAYHLATRLAASG